MATWDSAYLLALFNRMAQRPASDEITSIDKYAILARAQVDVISEIATRYPKALYGAPAACTTADRKTYTFGNDGNGNPLAPLGAALFRSLNDVPDYPVESWEYTDEGTRIRWNGNRTGPATLYWQGVTIPADIAAATPPVLEPAPARKLIVIRAVRDFAGEGNRRPDIYDQMEMMWAKEFPIWMLQFRKRYRGGGSGGSGGFWNLVRGVSSR